MQQITKGPIYFGCIKVSRRNDVPQELEKVNWLCLQFINEVVAIMRGMCEADFLPINSGEELLCRMAENLGFDYETLVIAAPRP